MLDLRPICEHCAKPLPPDSTEAYICSFECTYCATCALKVLGGVCPACAGNFVPRPIRPKEDWTGHGATREAYPATGKPKHHPVDVDAHAQLLRRLADIHPHRR